MGRCICIHFMHNAGMHLFFTLLVTLRLFVSASQVAVPYFILASLPFSFSLTFRAAPLLNIFWSMIKKMVWLPHHSYDEYAIITMRMRYKLDNARAHIAHSLTQSKLYTEKWCSVIISPRYPKCLRFTIQYFISFFHSFFIISYHICNLSMQFKWSFIRSKKKSESIHRTSCSSRLQLPLVFALLFSASSVTHSPPFLRVYLQWNRCHLFRLCTDFYSQPLLYLLFRNFWTNRNVDQS